MNGRPLAYEVARGAVEHYVPAPTPFGIDHVAVRVDVEPGDESVIVAGLEDDHEPSVYPRS
jgi:hypothetical protein